MTKIRPIATIVTPTRAGPLHRLIGSVDIDGQGTSHPSLTHVDPFIFLDCATIPIHGQPTFGRHPHRGHSIVTVILNGQVSSWDSFTNVTTTISAPASYWVNAGSGIFHDEVTVVPDETDRKQHTSIFQFWIGVQDQDRYQKPTVYCDTNLKTEPLLDAQQTNIIGTIRYHVRYDDNPTNKDQTISTTTTTTTTSSSSSSSSIQTPHPIIIALVQQHANTTCHFPIPVTHGGCIINLNGSDVMIDGTPVHGPADTPPTVCGKTPSHPLDVLVFDIQEENHHQHHHHHHQDGDDNRNEKDVIEITTSTKGPATYLLCMGERMKDVWYKKLVANGTVIAASPEEVRAIAIQAEDCAKRGHESGIFTPFGIIE